MTTSGGYRKVVHRRIAGLLRSMKADLLASCQCYFGGGTAVVMMLDEYRESRDIDFLCASPSGYRRLREVVFDKGLSGLFDRPPKIARQARSDQYGIRAALIVGGAPIKFEIIREGRVSLGGKIDSGLGVPVLSRADMAAEKLLANADRGLDRATRSRDYIDLVAMQLRWGRTPVAASRKAHAAYGRRTIESSLRSAERMLADRVYRTTCVTDLSVEPWVASALDRGLRSRRPPSANRKLREF
jgi:hypothetical protein